MWGGEKCFVDKWVPDGCKFVSSEADIRMGGKFRETMNCGGETYVAHGVYQEIVPNQKIVFTHQWKEQNPIETVVTVKFREKKDGTEIILTQTGFSDPSAAKSHEEGWSSALANFAKTFE